MKKNETYDIFVCISFSLAVICALSVFFENFIPYNAIVFGVSLGSVWLRAVAAVILLATSTVSVKLRIDSKHGKSRKENGNNCSEDNFSCHCRDCLRKCCDKRSQKRSFLLYTADSCGDIECYRSCGESCADNKRKRRYGKICFCRHDAVFGIYNNLFLCRQRAKNNIKKQKNFNIRF